MTEKVSLTFENGLVESVEDSMLPPGTAATIENWRPDPTGNIRVRPRWNETSVTGRSANWAAGRGMGVFAANKHASIVQHVCGEAYEESSDESIDVSATWSQATTEGNFLLAIVNIGSNWDYDNTTGVTFTGPGDWTRLSGDYPGDYSQRDVTASFAIFYKVNAPAESEANTFTIDVDTAISDPDLHAFVNQFEVENVDQSDPFVGINRVFAYGGASLTTVSYLIGDQFKRNFTANTTTDTLGTYTTSALDEDQKGIWGINHDSASPSTFPAAVPTFYQLNPYYISIYDSSQVQISETPGGTPLNFTATGTTGEGRMTAFEYPDQDCHILAIVGGMDKHTTSSVSTSMNTGSGWSEWADNTTGSGSMWGHCWAWSKPLAHGVGIDGVKLNTSASNTSDWYESNYAVMLRTEGYDQASARLVFAYMKDSGDPVLRVAAIDPTDLDSGDWIVVNSSIAGTNVNNSLVAFCQGNSRVYFTHQSLANVRYWIGEGFSSYSLPDEAPRGRCIAFHKNRLFLGGPTALPWRLYYSEVGDDQTWIDSADPGTAGYIDVGEGDGEAIEDITPWENGLMIGKRSSLWFLVGSGPDSFRLVRLPCNEGVAPGRTLTPTIYGVICAGLNIVQVFNGEGVETISESIEQSYGMTGNWMSGSVCDETYFVLDEGSSAIWTLDLRTMAWCTESVSGGGTYDPVFLYNWFDNQFFQVKNNGSAATPGAFYRQSPKGTKGQDQADLLTEHFELTTPEMWLVGPEEKVTPKHLFLKIRQRGADVLDAGLVVTPIYDGTTQESYTIWPRDEAGVYWDRHSIGSTKGVNGIQFKFEHDPTTDESVTYDLEEMTMTYDIETRR